MDLSTYEETRLPRDDSWAKWLKVRCHALQQRNVLADLNSHCSTSHIEAASMLHVWGAVLSS